MKGKENKKRHLTVMTILEEKCGVEIRSELHILHHWLFTFNGNFRLSVVLFIDVYNCKLSC
jgi:hypothetical protein